MKSFTGQSLRNNVNREDSHKEREECKIKKVSEQVFKENKIPQQNIQITQGGILIVELMYRKDIKCLPKTWSPYLGVEVEPLRTVVQQRDIVVDSVTLREILESFTIFCFLFIPDFHEIKSSYVQCTADIIVS